MERRKRNRRSERKTRVVREHSSYWEWAVEADILDPAPESQKGKPRTPPGIIDVA